MKQALEQGGLQEQHRGNTQRGGQWSLAASDERSLQRHRLACDAGTSAITELYHLHFKMI